MSKPTTYHSGARDYGTGYQMMKRIKVLETLLQEARSDLASQVDAEYPETYRAKYPHMDRRWRRDMDLCWRIDDALRDKEPKP